jgi:HD-like signal output (HDOD) protein
MTAATPTAATIVERVGELPTLPAIYARLAELTSQPDTSADDIEQIIEKDPALAAKLLKLVNSAFYGLPVEVRTIHRAVMIIGFKALSQLALSASVLNLFPERDGETFDYRAFWTHSIGVALVARHILMDHDGAAPEEAFLAGLVHDLGLLVHARQLPEEFERILARAEAENVHLHEAERAVLGFDHAATGHALVSQWRLPGDLASVVADHHAPGRNGDPALLTSAVHVACVLCAAAGVGREGVDLVPPLSEGAWQTAGFSARRLGGLLDDVQEEIDLFLEMIG